MQERNQISRHRAGVPLPDEQLLRDLQLTIGSSGTALAGAVHNPLSEVAGAARPVSVLERAGIQRLTGATRRRVQFLVGAGTVAAGSLKGKCSAQSR